MGKPQHSRRYRPEFDMRTRGERWHEEVENEGIIKPLLTFTLAMASILAIVIVVGGSQGPKQAHAKEDLSQVYVTWNDRQSDAFPEAISNDELENVAEEPEVAVEPEEDPIDCIEEPVCYEYVECPSYYEPFEWETGNLRYSGIESDGTYTYTWYSQNVLPGGGLDIPGRHVDEGGYVCDGDGNIVVASSNLDKGTVVETPYGTAKVYDTGYLADNHLDVYTAW